MNGMYEAAVGAQETGEEAYRMLCSRRSTKLLSLFRAKASGMRL
jgi:hypothetical protein